MGEITQAGKKFANRLHQLIGGEFSVFSYGDERGRSTVDILRCIGGPSPDITTYVTLDLHKHANSVGKPPKNIRVDLMGMCYGKPGEFGEALSTAAFCIINSRWPCFPGAIFPDIVSMHKISRTMAHVMFAPPVPWDRELGVVKVGRQNVHCLSMIPISESEYRFAEKKGSDALEEKLAKEKVDVADLNRRAVV